MNMLKTITAFLQYVLKGHMLVTTPATLMFNINADMWLALQSDLSVRISNKNQEGCNKLKWRSTWNY